MYLAQIEFGSSKEPRAVVEDVIETYLAALLKNGQIYDDYYLARSKGRYIGFTHLARPNAHEPCFHSSYGKEDLKSVASMFGRNPTWRLLDDDVPRRFADWRRSSSFYLFANLGSPVCSGDTGHRVPLYLLPVDFWTRENLYFWSRHNFDLDNVWLASGALEIPAYKQLADPRSELAQDGREFCAKIEKATGIRTFYYLFRYWGRRKGEADRPCPLCGRSWADGRKQQDPGFHNFDFRCVKCRLVSNLAVDFEDQRHARIGEYRG